jgi:hypothetical protein
MRRKRTLLEGSESEVCQWRWRNGDDKSANKMDESGTREESDAGDAKNVERGKRGILARAGRKSAGKLHERSWRSGIEGNVRGKL